jgi:ABC-type transport system involved in multi-copper enzyme maturation permease subunit
VGKYLGLLMMSATNIAVMTAAFLAILGVTLGRVEFGLAASALLSFLQVAVVTAVAMLLTTVSTPILAALASFLFCIAGHFVSDMRVFAERIAGPAARAAVGVVCDLLPNLENLNAKGELVYGGGVSAQFLAVATLYAAGHAALILFLSTLVFERREFK